MKRSENLKKYFSEWNVIQKEFETHLENIKNNPRLSDFAKEEDTAALYKTFEDMRKQKLAQYRAEWGNIKFDYVPKGTEATPADRTAVLQTIIAVGKNMNAQMLNDTLAPIRKDPAALRLVRPVIDNQGLHDVFAETEPYKYIDAVTKMESYLNEAEGMSKKVEKENDSLKYAILKSYMLEFLNAAEEQLDIIRDMEAKL